VIVLQTHERLEDRSYRAALSAVATRSL